MLETLCIKSIEKTPQYECVLEMFQCLENKKEIKDLPKNPWKAHVHAFLSTMKEPDKRLGEAARAGYWFLDHQAFDTLKNLLNILNDL